MGLAASQCRLLFITSRQNDVSAKMQRISNDRLTLSRDEDDAYTKYNRMLNVVKYQNADGTDLSYNAIMGATAAQNGVTSVIQNASGAVVLNNNLASKLGLTSSEGTGSDFQTLYPGGDPDGVNALIAVAEPSNAESIIAATASTPQSTTSTGALTDAEKSALASFKKSYGEYPSTTVTTSLKDILANMGDFAIANVTSVDGKPAITDQTSIANSGIRSFTDIFNKGDGQSLYMLGQFEDISDSKVPEAASKACDKLKEVAGGIADLIKKAAGLSACVAIDEEVANIYKEAKNGVSSITANTNINGGNNRDGSESDSISIATMSAKNAVIGFGVDDSSDDSLIFFTDLTCVTKRLLNKMFAGDGDIDSHFDKSGKNTSKWSSNGQVNVVDVYNNFHFTVEGSGEDAFGHVFELTRNSKGYSATEYKAKLSSTTSVSSIYSSKQDAVLSYLGMASTSESSTSTPETGSKQYFDNLKTYYTNLYNQLAANGWTTQSNETIQSNLNQGLYYIGGSKISETYDPVSDEDAKDAAKTWYDHELKKIKRKEDAMDIENSKLQTEYQALTNDFNSVKAIIDSNVQKSFAYCQSA